MKKKSLQITIVTAIFYLCIFNMSHAINVTGADLSYKEPTLNADGTPLKDLDHTNIYVDTVKSADIPATALTGGGTISIPVNVSVPTGQVKVVSIYATATDKDGNESAPSATITIRIDKLAPKHPD